MIEVHIWRGGLYLNSVSVAFTEKEHDKVFACNFYTGERKEIDLNVGEIPEKFILKIPGFLADSFFKSFAEVLDKQGVKTDNDAKIQGTLDATKYHLEDLRTLLKIKK